MSLLTSAPSSSTSRDLGRVAKVVADSETAASFFLHIDVGHNRLTPPIDRRREVVG